MCANTRPPEVTTTTNHQPEIKMVGEPEVFITMYMNVIGLIRYTNCYITGSKDLPAGKIVQKTQWRKNQMPVMHESELNLSPPYATHW